MGLGLGLFIVVGLFSSFESPKAQAATGSTTLNFQARLLTATGGLVSDGNYNVEFKIYDANSSSGSSQGSCSGDAHCLWVETYTVSGTPLKVVNGYLSARLGSLTAFSSSINWDQQLYLTMRVGGTAASPSWDAEMLNSGNRIAMTSVPSAFRANALGSVVGSNEQILQFAGSYAQATTITLPDPNSATATVCYQNATACGFIQNTATVQANANFAIQSASSSSVGGLIRGASGQSADLLDLQTSTPTTVVSVSASGVTTISRNESGTNDYSFGVTGTTVADAGSSLVRIGNAISSGSSNGTFLGINAPNGSTADFLDIQNNGTKEFVLASNGNLDLTGSLALKKGTDFSTTGTSNAANFSAASLIRLTGASTQTIAGIANGRDGYVLTLVNAAGQAATISNNVSANGANKILTGTGADVTLNVDASITLWYDATASAWRVAGQAAISGSGFANTALSNLSSVAINTSLLAGTDNSIDVGDSTTHSFRTGYFDTSVLSPLFDAQAANGALGLGSSNGGAITIGNTTNSTITGKVKSSSTAYQLQNASGTALLNIDSTADSANLITNGSFEQNVTGWTARNGTSATESLTQITSQFYYGTGSAQSSTSSNDATNAGAKWAGTFTNNQFYAFTVFAKASGSNFSTFQIGYSNNNSADTSCLTAQTVVTTGWTAYTCTFQYTGTTGTSYVYFKQTDSTNRTYYLDGAKLETVAGSTSIGTPYRESAIAINGVLTQPMILQNSADSTKAFQIQNAAGTSNLLIADTLNNRIGIGTATPNYTLDVSSAVGTASGNTAINVAASSTATASNQIYGISSLLTANPSSASTATFNGVFGGATSSTSNTSGATIVGGNFTGDARNGGNAGNVIGISTQVASVNLGGGAATVSNGYGIQVQAASNGGSTFTKNAGIAVGPQTAATNNTYLLLTSTAFSSNPIPTGNYGIYESVAGSNVLQSSTNNSSFLQVQNAIGSSALLADTTNLNANITNGNFEGTDVSAWTAKGSPTSGPSRDTTHGAFLGSASLTVTTRSGANGSGDGIKYATTSLTNAATYALQFAIKQISGTALTSSNFEVGWNNGTTDTACSGLSPALATQAPSTSGWVRYTCTFTASTAAGSHLYWKLTANPASAITFNIDAVQVEQASAVTGYKETGLQLNGLINSSVTFQNANDSTAAFQIQNAAATSTLLQADTLNSTLYLGATGSSSANSTIHIADSSAGIQNVTIGSSNSSSATTLQAGSGNINLNAGTIATNQSTLNLFNATATTVNLLQAGTTISMGATSGTLTVRNANQTLGNAAGSGTLTNNGSTKNSTDALGDLVSWGTASSTVDIYTSFSISPTVSGRTYTIPAPTDGAVGRLIFISNINASNTFTIGSTLFNAHSTGTLVYDGTSWNFAGMDGGSNNYIQNQSAADQSASFRIAGTAKLTSSNAAAFQVQNTNSRTIFNVDTSGSVVTVGNTTDGASITLGATGNATGVIRKTMVVNGTINANDLVEIDTGNAGQVKQAAANSTKVFGVATSNVGSGSSQDIVIGGMFQVNANTNGGTPAIGDMLVSSSTAGQVTKAGSTTSSGSVVGLAMSTISSGKIWVYINLGLGGSDNLQTVYNKDSGGTTPDIKVSSSVGGIDIQDADSSINGSLFTVRASNGSGLGTGLFDVQSTGNTTFQTTSNSNIAFQVQNATTTNQAQLLLLDTTNVNLVANSSAETDATNWFINTGTGSAPASSSTFALYGNKSLSINTSATTNAGAKYSTNTLLSATTTYSLSFWAKIASGSFTVQAGRSDTNVFGGETTCSLSSTTVTTTWTRFTCSFTTGGTITTGGYVFIRQSDNTSRTWYVDGVQLEQAASPTNYREGNIQLNGLINSPTIFQNQADTTTAFQIQNASGSTLFNADTANGRIGIGTNAPTNDLTFGVGNRTINILAQTASNTNGSSLTINSAAGNGTGNGGAFTLQAGSSGSGAAATGGQLNLQGGNAAGTGASNGGNVVVQGGTGSGTGVQGQIQLNSATVFGAGTYSSGTTSTITQSVVDNNSTIVATATTTGLTFTVPSPTLSTTGRVLYITNAASGSNAFVLSYGGGSFSLNTGSTATLIWNATSSIWTNAGSDASSLQQIYNNSSSPATITTTSSSKTVLIQAGSTFDSTSLVAVKSSGGTSVLDVDSTNTRVGIGTATPNETLEVNGGILLGNTSGANNGTIRYTGTDFQGLIGGTWKSMTTQFLSVNPVVNQIKATDQTINNTGTLTSDNALSFSVGANENWNFRFVVSLVSVNRSTGWKFSINAPSSTNLCTWGYGDFENAITVSNIACNATQAFTNQAANNASDEYELMGIIKNGSSPQTITIQYAQNSPNTTNSTVQAGSFLQANRVLNAGDATLQAWVSTGNSFGGNSLLGTNDNYDVSLETGGITRMNLASNGDVESYSNTNTPFGGLGAYGNMLTKSEQFDQVSGAPWTNTNVTTPTANTQVAPDGNTTAESLATSSSGGSVKQSVSGTNTTYTYSVYLKAPSGTQNVDLRIDSNGTPATGTAKTVTATTNWQRFTVSQTFSSGVTTVTPTIFPGTASGSGTVYAWGAQMVASSNSGVYTRTNSSAISSSIGFVNNGTELIQGSNNSTVAFQVQNNAGTNFLAVDTSGNIVNIGVTGSTNQTATENIGTSTGATQTVNIGSTSNSTVVGISSGNANISLTSNGSAVGTVVKSNTNSTVALQLQNASGTQLLNADSTADSANLITNGSFEQNTTGWTARNGTTATETLSQITSQFLFGAGAAQSSTSSNDATNAGATWSRSFTNNQWYAFSIYAKASGSNFSTFQIGNSNNNSTDTSCLTAQTVVTGGWTFFTCTFQYTGTTGTSYVYFKQTDSTNRTYYLDGAKLETVAGSTSTGTPYRESAFALNGTLTQPVTFQNAGDSTRAFTVQNAAGSTVLSVDTLNGGLVTLQPALSLSGGQKGLSQTFTAAPASGTVTGISQSITVAATGSSSVTGQSITVTDNSSSQSVTDRGLQVSVTGSNANASVIAVDVTASRGIAINATASGSAVSFTCGGVFITPLTICADQTNGASNTGTAIAAHTNTKATQIGSVSGTAIVGLNDTAGLASGFYTGILGRAEQTASVTSTSVGILGRAGGGSTGTVYGGYFDLKSGSAATSGSALFANNANVATNILELQDSGSDVFTVADNGIVTVKNSANSTTALQVQNTVASSVISIDTTNINSNLTNSSFEGTDVSAWTAKGSPTSGPSRDTSHGAYLGSASLTVTTRSGASGSGDGIAYITTSLTNSATYALQFAIKQISGTALTSSNFEVGWNNGSTDTACSNLSPSLATQAPSTTGWTLYTCTFTASTTAGSHLYWKLTANPASAVTFNIDAVQAEQASTTTGYKETAVQLNGLINSAVNLQNSNDSTGAFSIRQSAGSKIFNADTLNNKITLGTGSGSAATVLILGNKTDSGDPSTCTAGAMYYNSNSSLFRACQDGTNWVNMVSAVSLNCYVPSGQTLGSCTNNNTSYTWSRPASATVVEVIAVGGGGGGGAGQTGASGGARAGGGGGGGGAYASAIYTATDVGSSQTVTPAATAASAAAGNTSSFGSMLKAYGGGAGATGSSTNGGGGGGGGGTAGTGSNGASGNGGNGGDPVGSAANANSLAGSGAGGGNGATGVSNGTGGFNAEYGGGGGGGGDIGGAVHPATAGGGSLHGAGAGGGGAGCTSGNVSGTSAAGGKSNNYANAGGGTSSGGAGGNGDSTKGGSGGGGAATSACASGTGGTGGAGGMPGGGGGGGGAGVTGGSGGGGAAGVVWVIAW